MRLLLGYMLACLIITKAPCQDLQSKAFLDHFFGQSAKIVYMNKLWESEIEQMQNALAQDTLYTLGAMMNDPNDRLVLTQQEHHYIKNELSQQANLVWHSHLFEQGKVLTKATVDSIYNDPARGRSYFEQQYGSNLYSFSKPIFLRDYSLCIFYSGYSCGSRCGEGKLVVFKKEHETWLSWLELYRWIS